MWTRRRNTNAKEPKMPAVKVVLAGDYGVGKSTLVSHLSRYARDIPLGDDGITHASTIGTAFMSFSIPLDSRAGMASGSGGGGGGGDPVITSTASAVDVHLWDTSGQERFRSIAPLYYRDAHIVLLVSDVTDADTHTRLKDWVDDVRQHARVYRSRQMQTKEGVMPVYRSEPAFIAVLNKIDTPKEDHAGAAAWEQAVRDHIIGAGTGAGTGTGAGAGAAAGTATMVRCSARTGQGIPELMNLLRSAAVSARDEHNMHTQRIRIRSSSSSTGGSHAYSNASGDGIFSRYC
jgi:small GTP-binding protein